MTGERDVNLKIEIKSDKVDGDFAWTVWKGDEVLAVGFAASIEQSLFYIMNDLYGMQEVPLSQGALQGAVKV